MTIIFFVLLALSLMGLNLSFSTSETVRHSIFVFILACLFYVAAIWVVQNSAYGLIELSDSDLYRDMAEAMLAHWNGHDVWISETSKPHQWEILPLGADLAEFKESKEDIAGGWIWKVEESIHYPTRFDGKPIIYPLFVSYFAYLTGAEIPSAIYLNAIFLAAVVQLVFLIGWTIFESRKWGSVCGLLVILDTGFVAIGAFLLRDSIIVWSLCCMAFCLHAMLRSTRAASVFQIVVGILLLALIGLLRTPLHYAVILCFLFLITTGWGIPRGRRKVVLVVLIIGVICSLYALGGQKVFRYQHHDRILTHFSFPVHYFRSAFYRQQIIQLNRVKENGPTTVDSPEPAKKDPQAGMPSSGAGSKASGGVTSSADSRIEIVFQTENLLVKAARTVARSLFAPYPWSIFQQGRIGTWPELFFPGMFMWVLGLPLALIYFPVMFKATPQPAMIYFFLITIFCAGMYIAWDGEYSTRVRLMSMPFAWLMVAGGMKRLIDIKRSRKNHLT